MKPTATVRPLSLAKSAIFRPSATDEARGFSTKTSSPASMSFSATGAWVVVGVQT